MFRGRSAVLNPAMKWDKGNSSVIKRQRSLSVFRLGARKQFSKKYINICPSLLRNFRSLWSFFLGIRGSAGTIQSGCYSSRNFYSAAKSRYERCIFQWPSVISVSIWKIGFESPKTFSTPVLLGVTLINLGLKRLFLEKNRSTSVLNSVC